MSEKKYSNSLHTEYFIDGFRSLQVFSIALTPGINVLVGPNGSGKTNFILFLDFLDSVIRLGASAAVSSAGGISKVFCIENVKRSTPHVIAVVKGIAQLDDRDAAEAKRIFNFAYEIEIRFSRNNSTIYIARETLTIKKLRDAEETQLANSLVGKISLSRKSSDEETRPKLIVGPRLRASNSRNPLGISGRTGYTNKTAFERLEVLNVSPDVSFLNFASMLPALEAVRAAITKGKSFNIIPDKAREPDDLIRAPGIGANGSGLATTLHMLQAIKKSKPSRLPLRFRRISPESLDTLTDWTKLVFPELDDIFVVKDHHTGKYNVNLIIGKNPALKLPLAAASDGTVKWLALVCLIIISGSVYSIEEPENFLHPKMQRYLIELIRDSISDEARGDYFIVSTHSETLINCCDPRELILFEYKDGKTRCKRISSPDKVKAEINKTGFGLGYFYANNAIS